GVQTGAIRMTRYERVDDGSDGDFAELRQTGEFQLTGGNADVIAPWGVHELLNTMEEPAQAFVIRSRNLNDVWRNRFDLEHKTVKRVKSTRLGD
ncbi:MAG: hypothetical protein HW416_3110, partial [Chloroflexi bacterium]|nr:hypothetical protein [Chloroflexota bacterium]